MLRFQTWKTGGRLAVAATSSTCFRTFSSTPRHYMQKVSTINQAVQPSLKTHTTEQEIRPKKSSFAKVSNASLKHDTGMMKVTWENEDVDEYPYIWLRDNCQCSQCFHSSSSSRLVLLQDLHIDVHPKEIKKNKDGSMLMIHWSDDHMGFYPADWLLDRSFSQTGRSQRKLTIEPKRYFWGREMKEHLPEVSFADVMTNDEVLLKFIKDLEKYGLVLLREAKSQPGQLQELSDRVGYLKRTHFGEIYAVEQKLDATNLAYTDKTLDLHVDLPYLTYKSGVQLLHCIQQTAFEGGENFYVDAFNVAHQLRQEYPHVFDILTEVPVDFYSLGVEVGRPFHTINREPIISLDRNQSIISVIFNQMTRDSFMDIPPGTVREWYKAILIFSKMLYREKNLVTYKMSPGDVMVFDNYRVLHGRAAIRHAKGSRKLESTSWDWDMVRSCRRVLEK